MTLERSLPPIPIIEPFRIRTVEPLIMTTREERSMLLIQAHWNLFGVRAKDVLVDLLTDSGTGAMSTEQWAAIMRADESYAGGESFYRFEAAVKDITGMPEVIPTHQGRAAESILCRVLVKPGQRVLGNTHFDTTRAHIEAAGAEAVDLPDPATADPRSDTPFKGNIDLAALERELKKGDVPLVIVTATNNALGGHAVAPENLQVVRELTTQYGALLFLDAARFAENAALVRRDSPRWGDRTAAEIARFMFDLCDGCLMSGKKDALVNMGGFLALRDPEAARQMRELGVLQEGFPTYGGLSGRDLEAMAQGLREVLYQDYLDYRLATVSYLADGLEHIGFPVVRPPGGHAVFIDARAALPHIPPSQFPAQALACALYLEGGIRSVEIGTLMFGDAAQADLVRLALPRRVYTQSHIDYVIAIAARVGERKRRLRGLKIVSQPKRLRHFTAQLAPIDS
jgi:tyrosine phenol-lyase